MNNCLPTYTFSIGYVIQNIKNASSLKIILQCATEGLKEPFSLKRS